VETSGTMMFVYFSACSIQKEMIATVCGAFKGLFKIR